MRKMTKSEVQQAMRDNNINMETLRNYCIDKIGTRFSTVYLYKIINGERYNADIELTIWKLFRKHILNQRQIDKVQITIHPKYNNHNFKPKVN